MTRRRRRLVADWLIAWLFTRGLRIIRARKDNLNFWPFSSIMRPMFLGVMCHVHSITSATETAFALSIVEVTYIKLTHLLRVVLNMR
jgi:hypothetical protein